MPPNRCADVKNNNLIKYNSGSSPGPFFFIMSLNPALYLLPTALSDAPVSHYIPDWNFEIMGQLRYFIVENMRTARRWIRRCDPSFSFNNITMMELNRHTPADHLTTMLEPLRRGEAVGLMSEAGCPAVADPGADIVAIAQKEGLKVVPMVGPSSILLSLMASGFNGQSFCFHGYLPIDDSERRKALLRLEKESEKDNRTQIFIETPYRNNRLLLMMAEVLQPDTRICVGVDITDPQNESILTKTASEWKSTRYDINKRPAIFLLYREGFERHKRVKKRR